MNYEFIAIMIAWAVVPLYSGYVMRWIARREVDRVIKKYLPLIKAGLDQFSKKVEK